MMHPWAQGIISVVNEVKISEEKTSHTPGSNVGGKVLVPIIKEFPLLVKSLDSGKISIVNVTDVVYIESKNLNVEIAGYVGTKNPIADVKIKITRPDGTEKSHNVKSTKDGKYYLQTTLSEQWQAGKYDVSVFYGKNQIGNISFEVFDKKKEGFGGIIKPYDEFPSWLKQVKQLDFQAEIQYTGWFSLGVNYESMFKLTQLDPNDLVQKNETDWFYIVLSIAAVTLTSSVIFLSKTGKIN